MIDARVVFLTHYIPLYQTRVLQSIARQVADFHVLVSTPIEPNRDFSPDWTGLNVDVQDTWTYRRRWRHRGDGSFCDSLYIHVPYDTSRRLEALRPDVVLSLELGARSVGAAMYRRRHADSRLVLCTYMSERTEQSRGFMRRFLRRRLLRRADAVTYNGPSCLRYLHRYGVSDEKLFPLPYAADDRTLYHGPVDRDDAATRHRFIVIGQLTDRKGIVPMVRQLRDYARRRPAQPIEVTCVGEGPHRTTLSEMELPPNVDLRLLGNVPADRLAKLLIGSGAMIAPTLADEWMLAVNEALQAGLPVIGSIHAQAVTTLVRPGVNGWTYDPVVQTDAETEADSPSSLGRCLDEYFAASDDQIRQMRNAARSAVAERTPAWAAAGALRAIRHVLDIPADEHDPRGHDPSEMLETPPQPYVASEIP